MGIGNVSLLYFLLALVDIVIIIFCTFSLWLVSPLHAEQSGHNNNNKFCLWIHTPLEAVYPRD